MLLVEQEQVQAARLLQALHSSPAQIHWVTDAAQIRDALRAGLHELLLLSWRASSQALSELLWTLRANPYMNDLPIVVLSPCADARAKIVALDAGADDYVVTPCDSGELHARIRALLRRPWTSGDATLEVNGLHLDPHKQKVRVKTEAGPKELSLSPQEFRVLHFLVQHPGRVHTRAHLLDRVWGSRGFVGERTVDVHVRKLHAALTGTVYESSIETVWGEGYCLAPSAQSACTRAPH